MLWLVMCALFLLWTPLAWAFSDPTLLDNCDGAEDPLSTNWAGPILTVDTGQLRETGGTCQVQAGSGNRASYRTETFGPDTWVAATMPDATSGTATHILALFVRLASPNVLNATDGYACYFEPSDTVPSPRIRLFRLDNSVLSTALATTTSLSFNVDDGDKVGCEIIGTTLKAFVDVGAGWVEALSVTDATYSAAGNVGAMFNTNQISADNFSACTVSGGACTGGAAAGQSIIID